MAPQGKDRRDDLVGGPPEGRAGPAWWGRGGVAGRRWRAAVLVVVAVLVAVVVGPQLSLSAGGSSRGQALDGGRGSVDQPLGAAAIRWPLRGDLAADDAFVAAALRRLKQDRPRTNRPLYAGRLPDGSRLLFATNGRRAEATGTVALLHIAAGQAVKAGAVSDVATVTDPDAALAWATTGRDGSVYAVALGPPRPLRLELSARVDFDSSGVPSRHWLYRSSRNGVVVADLGRGTDPAVVVRSRGALTPFATPDLIAVAGRSVTPPDQLTVAGVDEPGYQGPGRTSLAEGLVAQTANLLDLGDASLRVIWSAVPWRSRHMALVLVSMPSGQRLQALVGELDGGWYPAGLRVLPRGAPDRLPWLLEPSSSADPTQLLCPTGGGSLDYLRKGLPVARVPITDDGVATLLEPGNSPVRAGGADVVLRDRRGHAVLRTRLPTTGFDNPFALASPV